MPRLNGARDTLWRVFCEVWAVACFEFGLGNLKFVNFRSSLSLRASAPREAWRSHSLPAVSVGYFRKCVNLKKNFLKMAKATAF